MNRVTLINADVLAGLATLPDESVQCVVTSPPYWGLRDYGTPGQIGLEPTIEEYVDRIVMVFREVRRVLRPDGTLWLNLGDSYASNNRSGRKESPGVGAKQEMPPIHTAVKWHAGDGSKFQWTLPGGQKPKDLCGIPWRVALALQADGWWLRSDIIWCLSGGTWLYVRTQKGDMPMMVRDVARLDPATVKFWNGKKWTQLLGVSQSARQGDEIEMVLRSGERISCTPTHQWPTSRGLLPAADIQIGDVLDSAYLPEPEKPKDCVLDEDAAWFAGLYIAEGSKTGDTIQIAGHSKETDRLARVERIAAKFGGSATVTVAGNKQDIRIYGKVLNAILDELVTGRIAKDKGFAPVVWRYSNRFIAAMIDGYLSGDGHWDEPNNRWRLGFTRNYNLERDLRVACARLGYRLVLNLSTVKYDGRRVPTFRGELRKSWTAHHNQKELNEVVKIRKSRCRNVYDLGVKDAPNLFALASGVLTHNSKPNPMPESCTDRPTKAHEYIFLLTKSAHYFWDQEAVREASTGQNGTAANFKRETKDHLIPNQSVKQHRLGRKPTEDNGARNLRTVWEIATHPFPGSHFATFPPELVRRCVAAGTSEKGCCPTCGAGWKRVVEKTKTFESGSGKSGNPISGKNGPNLQGGGDTGDIRKGPCLSTTTTGWTPTCTCFCFEHGDGAKLISPVPCTILDPFSGAGTTGLVAAKMDRDAIGIELSPAYVEMSRKRIAGGLGMLAEITLDTPGESF